MFPITTPCVLEKRRTQRSTCAKPSTLNNPIFLHIWVHTQAGPGYFLELRVRSKMVRMSGNRKILQSGTSFSIILEKTRTRDRDVHEGMALVPSVKLHNASGSACCSCRTGDRTTQSVKRLARCLQPLQRRSSTKLSSPIPRTTRTTGLPSSIFKHYKIT